MNRGVYIGQSGVERLDIFFNGQIDASVNFHAVIGSVLFASAWYVTNRADVG
jgi:hypothetical protein